VLNFIESIIKERIMGRVLELESPSAGKVLTYLVISDLHSIFMDMDAYIATKNALRHYPKEHRRVILLGDVFDFDFMHSGSEAFKINLKHKTFEEYFIPLIDEELSFGKWLIEDLSKELVDSSCIYWSNGNHDSRLLREPFYSLTPQCLRHNYDLELKLELKKLGIKFIDYNDFFLMRSKKSPDLYLTHGIFHGSSFMKKHFEAVYSNIVFGHMHVRQTHAYAGFKAMHAYANACLRNLDADYLGGKPSPWTQGFTLVHRCSDYIFVNQYQIQDGKCYL
jgi:Calcineurin-like phosphoesterase